MVLLVHICVVLDLFPKWQAETWSKVEAITYWFNSRWKIIYIIYIFLSVIWQLEKYSSNLEAIVADRTKELQSEKAKTEMLISQMFPKSVAEDLKHGRTVEAESFECVTIFFRYVIYWKLRVVSYPEKWEILIVFFKVNKLSGYLEIGDWKKKYQKDLDFFFLNQT